MSEDTKIELPEKLNVPTVEELFGDFLNNEGKGILETLATLIILLKNLSSEEYVKELVDNILSGVDSDE